jgi:HNH endonuclease
MNLSMTPESVLNTAINIAGSKSALGRILGVSPGAVSAWTLGAKIAKHHYCGIASVAGATTAQLEFEESTKPPRPAPVPGRKPGQPVSTRVCSVEGCGRKHKSNGLCVNHHERLRRTGSPTTPLMRAPNGQGYHTKDNGYQAITGGQYEHIAVAEKALGKPLPKGAEVHHLNEIRADNRPENLVICPDQAYHALLHRRARAIAAGVDPNWIKCGYCHQYDAPENMMTRKGRGTTAHRACNLAYGRQYWKAHKGRPALIAYMAATEVPA